MSRAAVGWGRRGLLLVLGCTLGCTLAEPPACEPGEETACFKGAFRGLLGERKADVEVCTPELDDIACVTADAEGTWKLPGLPVDTDVLVTARVDGAVPTVLPQTTSMAWYDWYKVMVPESVMNTNANNVDAELDPERGHILFLTWEGLNLDGIDTPNVPGVRVTSLSGEGQIFYANSLGLASSNAEETPGNGTGGLLNLEPGVHELRFEGPGGPCVEQMFHWAMDAEGVVPVPVVAGHTTAIDVLCPTEE